TTTELETTVVVKKAKLTLTGTGSRGRIQSADVNGPGKPVVDNTCTTFRAFIATQMSFPDNAQEVQAIAAAWRQACQKAGIVIDFVEDIRLLVAQRGPQMRGEVKTKARAIVELLFGLKAEDNKRDTRDCVEKLLDRFNFVFKEPEARKGMYGHLVIQTIINKVWFGNRNADGVRHPSYSQDGRIPLVTIALVLTAVENVLDEWLTGEHVDIPFSAHGYREKFNVNLKTLKDFAEHTQALGIVTQLRKRLLNTARRYAKVDENTLEERPGLVTSDFEAARREWE
ncbi:hypothetical protein BC835DRAFT_1230411, partial [Cytidiella melzeri]